MKMIKLACKITTYRFSICDILHIIEEGECVLIITYTNGESLALDLWDTKERDSILAILDEYIQDLRTYDLRTGVVR